eukprot:4200961-Amphidinium_carterae.1
MVKERLGNKTLLVEADVEALELLSSKVRMELKYELYMPRLCVLATVLQAGDGLFSPGKAAERVYLVADGSLSYALRLP